MTNNNQLALPDEETDVLTPKQLTQLKHNCEVTTFCWRY